MRSSTAHRRHGTLGVGMPLWGPSYSEAEQEERLLNGHRASVLQEERRVEAEVVMMA